MKINMFIDRMNRITKIENRLINLSSFMYEEENCMTLAEIIKTAQEKRILVGSAMRLRLMGVDEMVNKFHSIMYFEFRSRVSRARIVIIPIRAHSMFLVVE